MTTLESVAIIFATLMGPIFAVMITFWREGRKEQTQRRFYIFRTLMATRRIAISREHVDALNLIEVDFYGRADVILAYQAYIRHLSTASTPEADTQWGNTRQDLLAKLLHQLSVEMKIPIGEIDLRNGGYSPSAWAKQDRREQFVDDLARGHAALPIHVVNMPLPVAPPPVPGPQSPTTPGMRVP